MEGLVRDREKIIRGSREGKRGETQKEGRKWVFGDESRGNGKKNEGRVRMRAGEGGGRDG